MGSLRTDGGFIDEGEFKNFEMDLIIPSQYGSQFEYIEKFLNIDVDYFMDSSRDFVVQGEMLKLFLVLQPPKTGPPVKLAPKTAKDDYNSQPNIGYHVDVKLRNPDDFTKTGASPHPSSKQVLKTIMISNPKHGHVRHTPKLNNEYDTETANNLIDGDTAYSSGSDATATSTSIGSGTATASTITAATVTTPTATATATTINSTAQDDSPKGPLSDHVVVNSPSGSSKARSSSKPNFFRLPDGTIVFPIEIPVGVKSKYNNKDISVVVSVARVMQPPPGGVGNGLAATVGGKLLGDALHTMFPGSPMAQQYVTSATKLEKLLSTQYPQYWQYSQYSRGGVGNVIPPTEAKTVSIHNSHSNPNLVGLGGSASLTRTASSLSNAPSTPTAQVTNTLSNNNSRSDPNISSLGLAEDTLSPLPSSTLLTPTTPLTSRGSSGNLYGMGQLQTSTSSTTLSFASVANPSGSHATAGPSTTNSNIGVSSGAPVAIKTAQKIVRVLEPLQVRLLQHYSPNSLKLGTKRLIPVAVSNTHPTLPIIVRGLQLVLSNIPSLEGNNGLTPGPVPDIPYNHISVTDKYKTSTLDIETFPVTVVPGDEYHFVVAVEPHSPSSSPSSVDPTPPTLAPNNARHSVSAAHHKRRVVYTLQAQLVITWSIPCSPGSILSIHPLPVSFPAPHDLLVSFDSRSPVRAHVIFNVCFTITNLSDYSRDLTFIIPRPICVTGAQSTSASISTSTSSLTAPSARAPLTLPRSPPSRSSTLPTIKFTPASMSTSSLPSVTLPTRIPSALSVSSVVNSASTSSLPSPTLSPELSSPTTPARAFFENDMAVDEDELITRFGELQSNSASMLCLEKTLYVGLVKSKSSVSVNVRYIPLREGLFEIQGLQIFDRANDQVYVVQDTCQLYVIA